MEQQQLYGNQGYNFDRLPRKTITIDLDTNADGSKVYTLQEPITIDKLSDIYIDSFITNHIPATSSTNDVFILDVKEFNIQSVSNNQYYHNKLLIPNTIGTPSAATTTIAHRATKFNFISSINPTKLTSLEISLTDNNTTSGPGKLGSGAAYITFMIVARD